MICHSKKCHRPSTSSFYGNLEVKQAEVAALYSLVGEKSTPLTYARRDFPPSLRSSLSLSLVGGTQHTHTIIQACHRYSRAT